MLSKFNKYFKIPSALDKIHRSSDDAYALQLILKLFPEYSYLPFTPFSLNPTTIVHIMNDILLNERKQVVEFGSGISTIVIARFIKMNNLDTKILSIDNNSSWSNLIYKELLKYDCLGNVKLVVSVLKNHNQIDLDKYSNRIWYDYELTKKEIFNLDNNIDCVIIDGPSTGTSKFARYPTFSVLYQKLSNSYIIFLDDTRRKAEKEILIEWNKIAKGEINFEKMYGIIRVGKGFSSKPLSH